MCVRILILLLSFLHISLNIPNVNSLVPFPISISETTWKIRHSASASAFSFHSTFPYSQLGNQLGQHKLLAASNSKYFRYHLTAFAHSHAWHLCRLTLRKHWCIEALEIIKISSSLWVVLRLPYFHKRASTTA